LVSFDYSDALTEIDAYFRKSGGSIIPFTFNEILSEHLAQKLAYSVMIRAKTIEKWATERADEYERSLRRAIADAFGVDEISTAPPTTQAERDEQKQLLTRVDQKWRAPETKAKKKRAHTTKRGK
jgi:hypothetical protein